MGDVLSQNEIDNLLAALSTGELDVDDDAVWNGYVAEMEGMGLEDYLYIYQTALDRMLAVE